MEQRAPSLAQQHVAHMRTTVGDNRASVHWGAVDLLACLHHFGMIEEQGGAEPNTSIDTQEGRYVNIRAGLLYAHSTAVKQYS